MVKLCEVWQSIHSLFSSATIWLLTGTKRNEKTNSSRIARIKESMLVFQFKTGGKDTSPPVVLSIILSVI
jgi:hypothetical protein